jgi:hypothetical protein
MTGGEIHIHEDDWGMRSLHPAAAWSEVAADLDESIAAAARNRAPGGVGYTAVHVISRPSLDYRSTDLRLDKITEVLSGVMPRVTTFIATASAGFDRSSHDPWGVYDHDAFCFGFDASCYIKLERDGDRVTEIWFGVETSDPGKLGALRRAFEAIDGLAESMLVDYFADTAGRIRDRDFMAAYMRYLEGGPGE